MFDINPERQSLALRLGPTSLEISADLNGYPQIFTDLKRSARIACDSALFFVQKIEKR